MSFELRAHKTIYRWLYRLAIGMFLLVACLGVFGWYVYRLPYQAPGIVLAERYVEIPQGASASKAADLLFESGIIRSSDLFLLTLKSMGKASDVKSGSYFFDQPQKMSQVVERITKAQYGLPMTTITLFEGEANFEYAKRLAKQFQYVNEGEFNRLAKPYEGYLFPDTYNIPTRYNSQQIIDKLRANFKKRTADLSDQIQQSQYSLDEIVAMASIIETEAGNASYATKQKVAGVLWRRIDIGMPLQADAVFSYIYQEHLPQVLFRHLEVDSPYNIYKHLGLPPGPISNPGADSIRATLNPIDTGNLFYITGNDGVFYYAKTLGGHNQNIRNHLR